MGVRQFLLLCGGVLVAMSGNLVSALNTEIIIPLYQFPDTESGMWVDIRDAALSGYPITGIMNPSNGPFADNGSTAVYQHVLNSTMGIGDAAPDDDNKNLTIICYIATDYGNQNKTSSADVVDEIAEYDLLYPGVCEGIFFDETSTASFVGDDGKLTDMGQYYFDYNEAARTAGKTVTFNPGARVDPVVFLWEGAPTVMGFENYYSRVETVGVPRTSSSSTSEQNAMLVHSALELESDSSLVKALVEKAACSGWGKVYFTGSTFDENPWDENTLFWDDLVTEVSQDIDITCPDSAESQMRIMVPLLPDPVPSASDLADMVAPILAVLSKSDYGDIVTVVLDASDANMQGVAEGLRDAGARIICYMDAAGLVTNTINSELPNRFNDDYVSEVCGGFYIDNFDTASVSDEETQNLYIHSQYAVAGGTMVLKPANEPSADKNAFLYGNDWEAASFQIGRVIVATAVDGLTSTTVPATAGARRNSAVMMTGYSGTAECVIADMAAESYGYAYVTEVADFTTLSSYWATLVSETSDPSLPSSYSCSESPTPSPTNVASPSPAPATTPWPSAVPVPTPSPMIAPTPLPTTASPPTAAPVPATTPPPTTSVVTACGTEPEATLSWYGGQRKLRIEGGGCTDLTRIRTFSEGNSYITDDILSQVEPGVWELDATLNVKANTTLKIMGQNLGECNELRLLTNTNPSRLFGNGGNVEIQDTKIFGWNNGAVDTVDDSTRGYILCRSCYDGTSDHCTMNIKDSTIGYLGYRTNSHGGLAWNVNEEVCSAPTAASAQNVTVMENYRGVYAKGADLSFDGLVISGGNKETIRVDTCSGYISGCTTTPSSSTWGIVARNSDYLKITDNSIIGGKGLFLGSSYFVHVTGNTFDPSKTSVRIRGANTTYTGNVGDGAYDGSGDEIGLKAQTPGCFKPPSTSSETAVNEYINSHLCD